MNANDTRPGRARLQGRRRTRDPGPPSIAREVTNFVAASLIAVFVFGAVSVPVLRHLGRTEAIRDARSTARLAAIGIAGAPVRGDVGHVVSTILPRACPSAR